MMVARIRVDVRWLATAAITPAFERTLTVVGMTRREKFVLPAGRHLAYVDVPQKIGYDQIISDPYVVTVMTAGLDLPANANVLDIGTGSGY